MGLTKQYRRYAACGMFNVVGSSWAGILALELKGVLGKYVAVGACEHVIIWDLRKAEKVSDIFTITCFVETKEESHKVSVWPVC